MVATQWNVPIPGPARVTRRERGTGIVVTTRLQSTLIWYRATQVGESIGNWLFDREHADCRKEGGCDICYHSSGSRWR